MRAKEKENHEKYVDLIALAKKYPNKTSKVPAFARLIQKLETDLAPALAMDIQAQQSTKGLTQEKNQIYSVVKTGVDRLCRLIIGYATDADNVVLLSDLNTLKTKFGKAKQADFASVCTDIITEVRKLSEHWADYGITEKGVSDVEKKLLVFKEKAPKNKEMKQVTKKAVKKRGEFFEKSSDTNKQILNISTAFMGQDDEFYEDILAAMKIGKRGPVMPQIKLIIKTGETQKPVEDQKARISGTDIVEKTNKKGEIRFKLNKKGTVDIEIPLPNGEVKIQKDVEVKRGKTTTVIVLI
ncbi:MAG: hypothetical protein JNL70_03335 [Saprospiraceae bacterium]|nr:hypothetical protein [Saprospiraceae bacterium]